jgi:anti-anti-sigma regulatory factor
MCGSVGDAVEFPACNDNSRQQVTGVSRMRVEASPGRRCEMTVISSAEDLPDVGRTDIPNASISVESRGRTTLLTVAGEVDASNTEFLEIVLSGFTGRSGAVVVDLTGSTLFGARPLRALSDCDRRCRRDGVPFVVATSPAQQTLLRRVDGSGSIRTATSVAVALELSEHELSTGTGWSFSRVDPQKLRC